MLYRRKPLRVFYTQLAKKSIDKEKGRSQTYQIFKSNDQEDNY